jgi:sulfur carrier protein ThiS
MNDDRTKADKAWEARQEAARYRIFNAATNAAEATDEADDETYFAILDQAGNAAEAAAAEITGYKTYADLLEALDTPPQTVLARRTPRAAAVQQVMFSISAGNVPLSGVKRTSSVHRVVSARDLFRARVSV